MRLWRHLRMREGTRISGRDAASDRHRVPAISLIRGERKAGEEGEKRKQEKGTVSRQVPTICLHIVFSRDNELVARDKLHKNDGNQGFSRRNREHLPLAAGVR